MLYISGGFLMFAQMLLKLIAGLLLLSCLLAGCSGEALQRNSYEMFRTMEREDCLKHSDLNPEDCYALDDYNAYKQQRQERLENDR